MPRGRRDIHALFSIAIWRIRSSCRVTGASWTECTVSAKHSCKVTRTSRPSRISHDPAPDYIGVHPGRFAVFRLSVSRRPARVSSGDEKYAPRNGLLHACAEKPHWRRRNRRRRLRRALPGVLSGFKREGSPPRGRPWRFRLGSIGIGFCPNRT